MFVREFVSPRDTCAQNEVNAFRATNTVRHFKYFVYGHSIAHDESRTVFNKCFGTSYGFKILNTNPEGLELQAERTALFIFILKLMSSYS